MGDYSQKERAWLWLSDVVGASVRAADQLVYLNDGLLPLFDAARHGRPIELPERSVIKTDKELRFKSSDAYIDGVIRRMERENVCAVTRDSADYPELLREVFDPPTVLYVKGRLRSDIRLAIAVIGSRKCTSYGREMAAYFGRRLSENGVCVVSGLAVGCDAVAAESALSVATNGFPTVAVLGSGVDVIYPYQHAELYERIIERGAVVSEFRMGSKPARENFPLRNRIISGISKGVLVIEAAAKSGTRITAECAIEQGRDVFAVPGRISDLQSVGTNGLIKCGEAKAVFDVDDILYEYGIFLTDNETPVKKADTSGLSPEQKIVYDMLLSGEKTADEICMMTGFSVSDVISHLTELELSGIIKQLPNGEYGI